MTAVKRFARTDAERLALRDRLRAQAMADVLTQNGRTYIEAGQIHYPLWRDLRQRLRAGYPLKVHFPMAEVVRSMGGRAHLYGPGDLLTLLYRFHPRGCVYREDIFCGAVIDLRQADPQARTGRHRHPPYPHTRDELEVGAITARLSFADCRRLYPYLRQVSTATAREMVGHYQERKTAGRTTGSFAGG